MATTLFADAGIHAEQSHVTESHSSGVSWGAVAAGAFVTASFSLILLALGAGLGLSAISPWSDLQTTASRAGWIGITWLIVIEIVASGLGGYLTGRLRTQWTLVHTDEVYFRDTANGLLAWSVALVISVTLLASAAATMSGGIAGGAVAAQSAAGAGAARSDAYLVDALFRADRATGDERDSAIHAEAERILIRAFPRGEMSADDQTYLAQMVAARTGISQPEAIKRIADVTLTERQAEDAARKATAHLLLWSFLALLMGAFSASFFATMGGKLRDHVRPL